MEVERLKELGFAQDQINEIEEGRKAGIDVSVYTNKEFLAIQMRQIRLGLQQGLEVKKYARIDYDWFQMEEIREGLREGLEIEKYASPEISYERMHQIRLGLRVGIDLSPYENLDAGVLKELRLAVQGRIKLVPYISEGYSAEQLEAIRIALEKGIDIAPYLNKEYLGISIQEISEGIEHGLDVSVYARPDYCWQQMREIRLGMEHRVDVGIYNNIYYSWRQMQEIRLGLEEGLDVSGYCKYIYTAGDMRERRLWLKENKGKPLVKKKIEQVVEEDNTEAHCHVVLSTDDMQAYLEVDSGVTELSRADVMKALQRKEVIYGIQYDLIDSALDKKKFIGPILVASGKPVIDGNDGWYEYFFDTKQENYTKNDNYGNTDYRNMEWFVTVEEGQQLAYYHAATSGEDGISVTGNTIPAIRGREQRILTGSGFTRLPDEKTYIAAVQGIATIHDFCLEVSKLLILDEVNAISGDVDFDGNIYIRGNVDSGAKIRAKENVLVDGYVESANIICDGSIILKQGVNASGNGVLKAGRDIIGQFFEAVELIAGGNIKGNYFLNCQMYASGCVNITGKKGVFAGGSVFAQRGLHTYNLGNSVGIATYVKLGICEQAAHRQKELEEAIRNARSELTALNNAHRECQKKYKQGLIHNTDIYLKLENAIYTKEKEIESLLVEKQGLDAERKKLEHICIVVDNELHEGVTIEIDGICWNAKHVRGVVIRKNNDRIAVFAK